MSNPVRQKMTETDQNLENLEPAQLRALPASSSLHAGSRNPGRMLDNPFQKSKEKEAPFTLGQLSFAPSTQTTVVTTTTTTTTTFPPFKINAPKHLHDLDPKVYPLAASPTPAAIKRFKFRIGDQATVFEEADDTEAALENLRQQQKSLRAASGKLQKIDYHSGHHKYPFTPRAAENAAIGSKPRIDRAIARSRKLQRTNSRGITASDLQARPSRLQNIQSSSPFTPPAIVAQPSDDSFSALSNAVITPEMDDGEFPQIPSPTPDDDEDDNDDAKKADRSRLNSFFTPVSGARAGAVSQDVLPRPISRARAPLLNTTNAQDVSLPSPSLSPVTAAANLQNRDEYFDDDATADSSLLLQKPSPLSDSIFGNSPVRLPSVQDIPVMLDAFEAMPSEMKNYYMYQILRRCPKKVLAFVAETVTPALKRDFLGELPAELAGNVVSYLDVRSLCRASQVSHRWRKIIDTDEQVWKRKFDAAGFQLGEPELKKAIAQGWGWQSDSRLDGLEHDLLVSQGPEIPQTPKGRETDPADYDGLVEASSTKRSKRKAPGSARRTPARKQRKIRGSFSEDNADFDTESLHKQMTHVDGPFAAAEAALAAVPKAVVNDDKLSMLHLHKSLYRRHHLFSKSWTKVEPRHLAFKAHNLNVVTCLQFDSERIVTGSDDTNIQIYDTQTGALHAKLEGHDGGVWALSYHGDQLVSGSTDRSVRIWSMSEGVCTHTFLGHTSTVRCLVILMPTVVGKTASGSSIMMPKQPLIITGSRDSTLKVWKLPKPSDPPFVPASTDPNEQDCPYLVRTLSGHGHSVRAIAAHGDTLVSGSYDYTVRVWSISTGETIHRLVGHGQKVYSVVLDHERNRCISGSMDNMCKVWSLDTGNLIYNLEGHSSLVGLLDLQAGRLVSAAADSNLRIWDLDSGVCVKNLVGHTGAITCFQHDSIKIVSGSDRSLKMWDVQTGEFVRDLLYDLSGVWQVKFDERRCVAAVQRNNQTYIEVLDFGASRDGFSKSKLGRRILVDTAGVEIHEPRAVDDDDEDGAGDDDQ